MTKLNDPSKLNAKKPGLMSFSFKPISLTLSITDDFKGSIIAFDFKHSDEEIKNPHSIYQFVKDALLEIYPDAKIVLLTGPNMYELRMNIDEIDFLLVPRAHQFNQYFDHGHHLVRTPGQTPLSVNSNRIWTLDPSSNYEEVQTFVKSLTVLLQLKHKIPGGNI